MSDKNLKNFYKTVTRDSALLYKNQFFVEIYSASGSGIDFQRTNDKNDFSYYVQSASIPGVKLVNGKAVFFGTEFRIPGVVQFDHNWTVNILLDEDLTIYKKLEKWRDRISSLNKNGGGVKNIENAYAKVYVLNEDHTTITDTFVLAGIWIKSLGDINLAYTNGGGDVLKIPAEFRYQYVFRENDGNPLSTSK